MPIIPCLPSGPMHIMPLRIRCRIGAALGSKDAMPLLGVTLNVFQESGFRPVT